MTVNPEYVANDSIIKLTPAVTMMVKNMPSIIAATQGDKAILGAGPEATTGPWVFAGTNDNRPFKDPLNTSKCAIVFNSWRSWTTSYMNTTRYPILQMSIFADSTRAEGTSTVSRYDAQEKALKLFNLVDPVLNDKTHKILEWNGVPIINSYLDRGPDIGPIPGETNKGLYILTAYYNVHIF